MTLICGIDEVGRGCLAGPVCSAAVIFKDPENIPTGLKDSKLLSEKQREALDLEIRETAWFAIAESSVEEIDELNILQASLLSMARAAEQLERELAKLPVNNFDPKTSVQFLIDGRERIPNFGKRLQKSVIGGDRLVAEISAASILAKVYRDRLMNRLDYEYPEYHFCKHKGYGTARHLKALFEHGATPLHRKSFAPVKSVLENFPPS